MYPVRNWWWISFVFDCPFFFDQRLTYCLEYCKIHPIAPKFRRILMNNVKWKTVNYIFDCVIIYTLMCNIVCSVLCVIHLSLWGLKRNIWTWHTINTLLANHTKYYSGNITLNIKVARNQRTLLCENRRNVGVFQRGWQWGWWWDN